VYYTRRGVFDYGVGGTAELANNGERLLFNQAFYGSRPFEDGPFANRDSLWFFSRRSPGEGSDQPDARYPGGLKVGAVADIMFPLLVSAIDPEQEAKLLNLDHAIVSGRYLASSDRERLLPNGVGSKWHYIPVIASSRTFVDDVLRVDVERLKPASPPTVPEQLASNRSYQFLTNLPGTKIAERRLRVDAIYRGLARDKGPSSFLFWEPSPTDYTPGSADEILRPLTVRNPIGIWKSSYYQNGFLPAPPDNQDRQFRRLRGYSASNLIGRNGVVRTPHFRIVGRYDPGKLPGFSALSKVPLETYYPPELKPADEAAREALGGKPLLPTQNLGDYVQQPPLLLTTLEGMKPFLNPIYYKGAGRKAKAPLSVIRIRVSGVTGADALSQARIKAVALAIRDRTGLDVDITAGSSPRTLVVDLPPGKFGRPALKLEEGWAKKGVTVAFQRAVDKKSFALSAIILVICAFFVANGAFAAVRARRREIGTLLCLGWSRRSIFTALLGEVALLGFVAGALGTLVAAGLSSGFALDMPLARSLLVLPVAVLLALLAGLLPARAAANSIPLDAVQAQVAGTDRRRRVRSLTMMAAANLRRLPARTFVGMLGLLVGVAALSLLLGVNRSFKGTLVDTLLGQAILVRIKGVDYLAVAVTIGLAGLSLADVLYLNLRERAPEFVTLRSFGWTEGQLRRLVALEGLGLGFLGGGLGALLALVVGTLALGVPFIALALIAFLSSIGGICVGLAASIAPLTQIRRLTPPTVLAEE
ncbi:MAG: ABC transporter permease, partial [Actinomycetota bacterium]|nr:ABC transporter permease [Actinomycetota bacterium]